MTGNSFRILKERGFLHQTTDDDGLDAMLGTKPVTCYIGFDATADSLHIGSLVPIMALAHMQSCGHRPIALLGGGTTMVGDPSGKSEMRQMLTVEQIQAFGQKIKGQFGRYLDFTADRALLLNNADWLLPLNYIEFLRDVGVHFSINKMLTAESVKLRLETGLSFIEFNYMLLQAYDFYVLARDHDCLLQMGGQDQWGNIVAGSDLTRRKLNRQVYGMTFPLITTASGEKFGKSAGNAVWLDADRTPVVDFYQYFRNTDDRDVERYLGLFTRLPMDEVRRLADENVNRAKEILAYEATRLSHGREQAAVAYRSMTAQFGSADPEQKVRTSSEILLEGAGEADLPIVTLPSSLLDGKLWVVKLFVASGMCASNGEARRLIQGGGAYINDQPVTDPAQELSSADMKDGAFVLSAGKKRHKRVVFE
jgi:tyrosyl-tRNA synthetase